MCVEKKQCGPCEQGEAVVKLSLIAGGPNTEDNALKFLAGILGDH
jgi:hypothetical protein